MNLDRIVALLGKKINEDSRRSIAKLLSGLSERDRRALSGELVASEAESGPPLSPLVDVYGDETNLEWLKARQLAPIQAVPTPLPTWNRYCRDDGGGVGIARGWFVAVGGNTKSGKSLLSLNLAESAIASGEAVGFVTLEMSVEQLIFRLLSISSGVPIRLLEKGHDFSPDALDQAWDFAHERYKIGTERELLQTLFVNREALRSADAVWAMMRRMYEEGCTFFVVDYLQLISASNEDDLYKQVFAIANALMQFKIEYNVTIIGNSQFNRATSADYTKSPVPQSLHGGSIENGVDQVLLLDHSRYERDEDKSHIARTWLLLGANRHGEAGDIQVLWDYTNLRLREGLPDEENEWPTWEAPKKKKK